MLRCGVFLLNGTAVIINKTQREGLIYPSLIAFQYDIAKIINIKNFLLRKNKISEYLKKNTTVKVHFGAGESSYSETGKKHLNGFLNSDIFGELPIDITKKLPFNDKAVDVIFSCHLIEHIYQRQFKSYLNESFRILKNDGQQIIATPSLEKLSVTLYGANKHDKEVIYQNHIGKIAKKFLTPAMIVNGMTHINYGHKFLYDFETIKYLALEAGYNSAHKIEYNDIDDKEVVSFLANRGKNFHIETEVFVLNK